MPPIPNCLYYTHQKIVLQNHSEANSTFYIYPQGPQQSSQDLPTRFHHRSRNLKVVFAKVLVRETEQD